MIAEPAHKQDYDSPVIQSTSEEDQWTRINIPKRPWFDLRLGELWQYRDLIMLFTRRNIVTIYKQTVLGPVWFFVSIFMSSGVFTLVFSHIANISTDGVPPFLFYFVGLTCWGYFNGCLTAATDIFNKHKPLFMQVYFPRIAMPLSEILSITVRFLVQFAALIAVLGYFMWSGSPLQPSILVLFIPLWVLQMALIGLGAGLVVSSFTTKYRDLNHFWNVFVGLWMWITPIVYPLSQVPEKYRLLYNINPVVAVVEGFRLALLGESSLTLAYVWLSVLVTLAMLIPGLMLFNQTENTFMDRV